MANMQIQKTRTVGTKTKTAVTQAQSLEIVQTMLYGGLSCLSYLRELFAVKAFDEQIHVAGDTIQPYEDFVIGRSIKTNMGDAESTRMRVLRRNRSKRVDKFLDWLEHGAFPALKDGQLHALQLYIHATPDDREKVIETYTFTFQYHADAKSPNSPATLEFGNSDGANLYASSSNQSLHGMLEGIINMCNNLPQLPQERYVSMALFYLADAVPKSKPADFTSKTSDRILFPQYEKWEKHSMMQELQAGFHRTALRTTSYRSVAGLKDRNERLPIPTKLSFVNVTSKTEEIFQLHAGKNLQSKLNHVSTPSTIVESDVGPGAATSDVPAIALESNTSAPNFEDLTCSETGASQAELRDALSNHPDTQTSNAPRMRSALQGMMQPEHLTQGDTQTQAFLPSRNTAMNESLYSQRNSSAKTSRNGSASASHGITILPSVALRLEKVTSSLRKTALKLAGTTEAEARGEQVVLCQCGHDPEESDMINCDFCDTWQHLHCYGFSGDKDPRIPELHACYQCLLGAKDKMVLESVRELVLLRRAMFLVFLHGLKRKPDFADRLGVDAPTGSRIYEVVKAERYVIATAMSHKPGFAKTGKPLFVPVDDSDDYIDDLQKMVRDLFDPLREIGQYYEKAPAIPAVVVQQVLALRSNGLPDAAKPHGSSLKKKSRLTAAATPASDLDLPRQNITPYHTPSRPPLVLAKRMALREEHVAAPPSKRLAAMPSSVQPLKSFQTKFSLVADGHSSPYQ